MTGSFLEDSQPYTLQALSQEERPGATMGIVRGALTEMEGVIDDAITAFIARCKQERRERRRAIMAAHNGPAKPVFSYHVFTYFHQNGSFILTWARVVYLKGEGQGKRVVRRLPCAKGVTHLKRVVVGAHPDEVELLKSHEYQARILRRMWSDYLVARKAVKDLTETAELASRMREDAMIAQA